MPRLQIRSTGIIWKLVRNAESQAQSISTASVCILTSPGDLHAQLSLSSSGLRKLIGLRFFMPNRGDNSDVVGRCGDSWWLTDLIAGILINGNYYLRRQYNKMGCRVRQKGV